MNRIAQGLRYGKTGAPLEVLTQAYDISITFSQSVNPTTTRKHLQLVEGDIPDDGVHVHWIAATVNPSDINQIEGTYALQPVCMPAIGGNEGVGRVIKVGATVKNIYPGQWVIPALPGMGTWRTECVCTEQDLYVIQDENSSDHRLSVAQAATIQVNPTTAYMLLSEQFVNLSADDVLIQNAANSAVGRCVIQMARMKGVKTVNIIRDRNGFEMLEGELLDLGADCVINEKDLISKNRTELSEYIIGRCGALPKLALNAVGGPNGNQISRLLQKNGVVVTYGGMSKKPITIPTSSFIYNNITFKGFWMSDWYYSHPNPKDPARTDMMNDLKHWISSGELKLKDVDLIWWESGWMDAIRNVYSDHKQVLLFGKL